jgi:hypothetical protein
VVIDWVRTLNISTLVIAGGYTAVFWFLSKHKAEMITTCLFEGLAIGEMLVRAFKALAPSLDPKPDVSFESASLFAAAAIVSSVSLTVGALRRATAAANSSPTND